MITEYINREEVCSELEKIAMTDKHPKAIKRALKIVSAWPKAGVKEVKKGRWTCQITIEPAVIAGKCSLCGMDGFLWMKFCPSCGAEIEK